ncbi:MAG: hemolysin family protein [Bacillota bacterium]|nr:hemolysin family protein [Bacillota bacterium]
MDDYGGSDSIWLKLALIAFLTLLNALLSATEMAVISLNKAGIEAQAAEGDKRSKNLLSLINDQTRFLSIIQVGITLAGFLSSASASSSMSSGLALRLVDLGLPRSSASTLAIVLITLLISYLSLVFGELVPKRIALQNAESVALNLSGFIGFLAKLLGPFAAFLSFSTKIVLKLMGKYSEDIEEKISEEELKSYIAVSQEQGVINAQGKDMMINIFEFDDSASYEIMTPRTELFMVPYEGFSVDTVKEILSQGHSRIPVYGDNKDHILGIVYVKDLFQEFQRNNYQHIDLDKVMKAPYFVPESKKIDQLLFELQSTKNYLALLVDEYGGISGLVTIEDIVEEIVGEIEDEYDQDEDRIEKIADGTYLIDGHVELKAINEALATDLDSDNHETIGGFAVEHLGYFPENISSGPLRVELEDYVIEVTKVSDNRISEVKLSLLDHDDLDENDSDIDE